jgi:DEAD/DEAH box helicase domain-containing protein
MDPSAGDTVGRLEADRRIGPQLVERLFLPAVAARFGEPDPALDPALSEALAAKGAHPLWRHQVEGLAAVRSRRNLLVTTPTASGKSLIFHLPVLEEALADGPGRGLFLYPLKALGQDQKAKLDRLAAAAGLSERVTTAVYDGDTPRAERERIKKEFPRVVISNPDMLHLGILGYWQSWAPFLRDLRWIVLDELHTYRGIFGSHFHHVLERLLRVCRAEGADPAIVASSATAANAEEFAERLAGRSFHWISESGAPREGRHFLLLRPEGSPYTLTLHLLVRLLRSGLKTIVFTKARRITELLYKWLSRQEPELARRVASYRSGFLAGERRRIERDLFTGRLAGVIATSALEMGIDVGGLDACVLVGYPGSMMATWQRSGRVGRADRESITALVAMPDALDQYLLDHPRELVERPCERLVVDPDNEPVTSAHLVCAAAEMPLSKERDRAYLERHAPLVGDLLRRHELVESAETGELHSARRRPHREVSLRGTGGTTTILDATSGAVVGTVDGVRVLHECHPGAIYLHAGRQFLVRELDLEKDRVHAEPVREEYFTTPLTEKETEILEVLGESRDGALAAGLGRLRVTERVIGYERKSLQGQEPIDRHGLSLPPVRFETVGLWWRAPKEMEETLKLEEEHFMGALHAAEHAAISLLPLHALCDRGDIGGISIPFHPQIGCGCVFIYDGHPGGIGIAARAFEDLPEVLAKVRALLAGCGCEAGCPSCVQSPKCGNGNRPLDKEGAGRLLRMLLGEEEPRVAPAGEPPPIEVVKPEEEDEEPVPLRQVWNPPGSPDPTVADTGPAAAPPVDRSIAAGPEPATAPAPPPAEKSDTAPAPVFAGPGPRALVERTPVGPVPGPRPVPPPRGRVRNTVLFDLETQRSAAEVGGWGKSYRMLVAIGVVCHLEEGRFEVFTEEGVGDLIARLEAAERVVGFNVKRFDYQVLSGYTGIDYERRLPTLDLLDEIWRRTGFRLGLGHLAKETLGVDKSADGLQSLEWVRQGRLDLVESYCRRDVEILRDLYLFGRRMGFVFYRDKRKGKLKLPVDW